MVHVIMLNDLFLVEPHQHTTSKGIYLHFTFSCLLFYHVTSSSLPAVSCGEAPPWVICNTRHHSNAFTFILLLKHHDLQYMTNIRTSLFLHCQTLKQLPTVRHRWIMTTASFVLHLISEEGDWYIKKNQ